MSKQGWVMCLIHVLILDVHGVKLRHLGCSVLNLGVKRRIELTYKLLMLPILTYKLVQITNPTHNY